MAKDASFDIVSEFDQQELINALDQARRDVSTRFDLKDTGSTIELEGDAKIVITAPDEFAASNIYQIVETKIVKRGMSPLILKQEKTEEALGGKARLPVTLVKGIDKELAKKITSEIKNTKLKVQASIQGEQVRVTGKSRDDLQSVISTMKEFGDKQNVPLQFNNFR